MESQQTNFPPPAVPIAPVVSCSSILSFGKQSIPFMLDSDNDIEFVTSGRVALARALQMVGVDANSSVLVPAYHCTSLVDPVPWLGATPLYYQCNEDLTPNMQDIEEKIDSSTRALVVVHYFGFAQAGIEALADFCQERQIELIEDCAHAAFGAHNNRPLGSFGSHAIASPAKFFPIFDGGFHLINKRYAHTNAPLNKAGLSFELKSLLNPIEKSVAYGHLFPLNSLFKFVLWVKDALWNWKKSSATHSDTSEAPLLSPGSSDGGFDFDPAWVNIAMSRPSRLIMKLASKARIINARRQNYRQLAKAFAKIDGCSNFSPDLPAMIAPYVFPLVIDHPVEVFKRLKSEGVPIYRWDVLYTDVCDVSNRYSTHLFQFPCHQELSSTELSWIIERVTAALTSKTEQPAQHRHALSDTTINDR